MRKKRAFPGAKTYHILAECIEHGLYGFLRNDMREAPTDEAALAYLVERAHNRIMIELDEKFKL